MCSVSPWVSVHLKVFPVSKSRVENAGKRLLRMKCRGLLDSFRRVAYFNGLFISSIAVSIKRLFFIEEKKKEKVEGCV